MTTPQIVDSHVHYSAPKRYDEFRRYLDVFGIERAGIVSLPDRRLVNFNPEAFEAKLRAPDRFFVFAGLDYTHWFYPGLGCPIESLETQAERLAGLGVDGIKMWAGKPTFQAELGFGLDDAVYAGVFEVAARYSLPIVLHVADPPQFWSIGQARFGWSPEGSAAAPSFELLQKQANTILARHRQTIFIFPHLMFRAGDLETFSQFMRSNENAYLDLSPGLYFYGDLHRQRNRAQVFFDAFKERILFGTDAMWFEQGHPYLPCLSVEDNLTGARRLLDFLSTGELLANPFTLTREELPTVKGLELPAAVLNPILGGNFSRIVGIGPRSVSEDAVRGYILEIEAERLAISGVEGAS